MVDVYARNVDERGRNFMCERTLLSLLVIYLLSYLEKTDCRKRRHSSESYGDDPVLESERLLAEIEAEFGPTCASDSVVCSAKSIKMSSSENCNDSEQQNIESSESENNQKRGMEKSTGELVDDQNGEIQTYNNNDGYCSDGDSDDQIASLDESFAYFEKVTNICQKLWDEYSSDVITEKEARCHCNALMRITEIHQERENYPLAQLSIDTCLEVVARTQPLQHRLLASASFTAAQIFLKLNGTQNADKMFTQCEQALMKRLTVLKDAETFKTEGEQMNEIVEIEKLLDSVGVEKMRCKLTFEENCKTSDV